MSFSTNIKTPRSLLISKNIKRRHPFSLEEWLKKSYRVRKPNSQTKYLKKNFKKPTSKNTYYYDREYVEKNLIAYIGNKRRLLDLIIAGVREVEISGSQTIDRNGLFVDYFAGTGVVSRLMKSLGFNVIANDWEYYSYCINRGFLECSEKDLNIFKDEGGFEKVLEELNALTTEVSRDAYISRYYCPKNDETPNPKYERLFYTHSNGILIDNIRSAIVSRYGNTPEEEKKKDILLALLLVQSSKRSNTSGVFKGFHYGFGGKKRDALNRILAPVALERPRLSDESNHSIATHYDALELARLLKSTSVEITYLDPPYNQHQYGSNYHLLNTIARNDRPQVNRDFWIEGKKINKSAIRKDWIQTKSGFCYQKTACQEFTRLVNDINSKYILVSYSSEGIIPLEDMIQILATKGKVGIITRSYVRYRGGRQADHTQNRNLEFILMVDTAITSTEKDIENVKSVFLSGSLQNLFLDFIPAWEFSSKKQNLKAGFSLKPSGEGFSLTLPGFLNKKDLILRVDRRLHLDQRDISRIRKWSFSKQQQVIHKFSEIMVRPNHIKASQIHDLLINSCDSKSKGYKKLKYLDKPYLFREFERYFNKINFRKHPELKSSLNKMKKNLNEIFTTT